MQSQVDFANISNNRIALQHVGYKYLRTKYLAFADWEDYYSALNPVRKIVPDVIQILKF